jgi:hypothetical protein
MAGDYYEIRAPKVGDLDDLPDDPLDLESVEDPDTAAGLDLLPVTPRSPLRLRRAAEAIARYFKREFDFDFLQYLASERTDPRDQVYLWVDASRDPFDARAVGAACFRWRAGRGGPPGLALAWLWLHPYFRCKGVLSATWPYFRSRLGDFQVEGPLSPAMAAFLTKHDPAALGRFEGEGLAETAGGS